MKSVFLSANCVRNIPALTPLIVRFAFLTLAFCNSNILAADSIDTTDQHVPALATETDNEPVTGLNVTQNNSQVNSENTTGNSTAISTGFFLPESVANLSLIHI